MAVAVLGAGPWRTFAIKLPDGRSYRSVINEGYVVEPVVDDYLQYLTFGRRRAAGTVETYASGLVLFLTWMRRSGHGIEEAARHFGRFMTFLRHYDASNPDRAIGPGRRPVRGGVRGNVILTAARGLYVFLADTNQIDVEVLGSLFHLDASTRRRGQRGAPVYIGDNPRPRHAFPVEESDVDNATIDEVLALFAAAEMARDAFMLGLFSLAGLRRGEALGLRMDDIHFLPDSTRLGCRKPGMHLHVVRRINANGASAKRGNRTVPASRQLVMLHDDYMLERSFEPAAKDSDYLLVNLFGEPLGAPMALTAANERLDVLSRRAGLDRKIRPHMLRHTFATNAVEVGTDIDVLQDLLGHRSLASTQVYLHPSAKRMRQAVDQVGLRGGPVSR